MPETGRLDGDRTIDRVEVLQDLGINREKHPNGTCQDGKHGYQTGKKGRAENLIHHANGTNEDDENGSYATDSMITTGSKKCRKHLHNVHRKHHNINEEGNGKGVGNDNYGSRNDTMEIVEDFYYSCPNSPMRQLERTPLVHPMDRPLRKTSEFLKTGERWSNGGWRTAASMVYCLAQFLVAVPDAVLGPTLTALGQQVSCMEEGDICPAMLQAIGFNRTGAVISVVVSWIMSEISINGHYVVSIGFAMVAISFLVCPFSTTPKQIHVSFFFIGLGKGLASLNSTALMVALRQGNQKKLSKWVNLLSIFWGLGSILTPLLVSLATLKDFRLSFFTVGILCLSHAFTVAYVRHKVPERKHVPVTFRESRVGMSSCQAHTIMTLGYVFAFLVLGVEFNIVAYITPYIESRKIGSNALGNLITSSYSFAFMVGRIVIGYLEVSGVSPFKILDVCTLVAATLAGIVSYFSTSIIAIWIGAIGWGMFLSPSWPCTIMVLRSTGELSDYMVQFFIFAIYSGQWTLDLVMDIVIKNFGTQALPGSLAVALMASFIVIFVATTIFYSANRKNDCMSSRATSNNNLENNGGKSTVFRIHKRSWAEESAASSASIPSQKAIRRTTSQSVSAASLSTGR
mmetsp:Transcript_28667/g.69875  ORF Transcript_28667/g.69875 Transcript_28667/m.69875 type:complete len:628 (-) Transcript_28667:27-1910(-)